MFELVGVGDSSKGAFVQKVHVAAVRVKHGGYLDRDVGKVLEFVPSGGAEQAPGSVEGRVGERGLHRAGVVEDEDDLEALKELHALGELLADLVLVDD